jgi:hypothetical protein
MSFSCASSFRSTTITMLTTLLVAGMYSNMGSSSLGDARTAVDNTLQILKGSVCLVDLDKLVGFRHQLVEWHGLLAKANDESTHSFRSL